VMYCSAEIISPGVIRHVEGTKFVIGEPSGEVSDRCRSIAKVFVTGGLKSSATGDIREQIWLKLIGNVAFNPVSALTRSTLGEMAESQDLRLLLRRMMEEAVNVATALGVSLPLSIDKRLEGGLAVGDHKTSMLQDLEAGRPLELDCLTGALAELAELLNVPVPYTRTIHACTDMLGRHRVRQGGSHQ
ncbi:MAG: oxidoreductase, partial [Actinomycetota bacterium]|nr:oxidoreductase [Actinomycetota bacterium]